MAKRIDFFEELSSIAYPGRGIMLGITPDGENGVCAYFIMGRSENSRNRIFVKDGSGLRTEAFDPSKVEDPSLIIYAPVAMLGNKLIVSNGDQTDTIVSLMDSQQTFEQALRSRTFEPDSPHYTPRISGIMRFHPGESSGGMAEGKVNYALSILKSDGGDASSVLRQNFAYENPKPGRGRFIHTYSGELGENGRLLSFEGEPKEVLGLTSDIDAFTERLWESLHAENKISLFVRYIHLKAGTFEDRIVNRHQKGTRS